MTYRAVLLSVASGVALSACGGGGEDVVANGAPASVTYACDVQGTYMCLEAQGPAAALQELGLTSAQCLSPAWSGAVVDACARTPLSGTCTLVRSSSQGQVLQVEYWYSPYWDAKTGCAIISATWTPY